MAPDVAARLFLLADEIRDHGNANATRLTIIKKWFEGSKYRLPAVAIFIATRAGNRRAKAASDDATILFRRARALLRRQPVDSHAAQLLHGAVHLLERLREDRMECRSSIKEPRPLPDRSGSRHLPVGGHSFAGRRLPARRLVLRALRPALWRRSERSQPGPGARDRAVHKHNQD